MQLDLTRFKRPHEHLSWRFRPDEVAQEDDAYRIVALVDLDLDVYKDKTAFRLVGTVRAALELPCSRCLEPFQLPIDESFDQRYLPASEMSTGVETEVAEEDLETGYYHDDRIDLNELLREQFYLALPMKPLCREQCRGLCPQCGTDLNRGGCACTPRWEDPRLAPLRRMSSRHS